MSMSEEVLRAGLREIERLARKSECNETCSFLVAVYSILQPEPLHQLLPAAEREAYAKGFQAAIERCSAIARGLRR